MKTIITLLTIGIIACVAGVFFAPVNDSQITNSFKKQVQEAASTAVSHVEEKAEVVKSHIAEAKSHLAEVKSPIKSPVNKPVNVAQAIAANHLEEATNIYTEIINLIDSQTGAQK